MASRELGEPTKSDLKDMKEIAEWLTMDAWDIKLIQEKLLDIWNAGHNQGYEDANTERDSL